MTYDEMTTAIAAWHDGCDAMQVAFSGPELAAQVTPDTAAAQIRAAESLRLGLIAAMECGEAADHVFEEIFANMDGQTLGRIMLAFGNVITESMSDTKINRHAAVDVADVIGPDWAQTWYRFIVLVTKVA